MWKATEGEPTAVVFVSDRQGAALERRLRCLRLAGIVHDVETEQRASGTYYKLRVRAKDAVAAHLALQMGGCGRSSRLRERRTGVRSTLRELARTLWEETRLLLARLADWAHLPTPRLLAGPAIARTRSSR